MAYCIWKSYKLNGIDLARIFEVLSRQNHCFFLDSSLRIRQPSLGRFSILGIEPFYTLKAEGPSAFSELREKLNRYQIKGAKTPFPFSGGAVGYLTYELGAGLESKVKLKVKSRPDIPGCFFAFYNSAVIIDHAKNLIYLFSAGFPETRPSAAKLLCQAQLRKLEHLISEATGKPATWRIKAGQQASVEPYSNFTKEEYLRAVKRAKEYIKQGDIYQVNLAQQFKTKVNTSATAIYQRLRCLSPSYFSAYFDAGEFQILSSSPERFLELKHSRVTTRPMKGTRPRGENKAEDLKLKKELLESEKDRAELTMIVDLERNDLGRVCDYSTIKVSRLRTLEAYRTVFQTTATVEGRLHADKDRIDLLRACFPGGSITGCPKIRAMQIIEELEPEARLIYTGALGYLSFSGDMDFNILIRSILKQGNDVYFGAGGGIVADSQPQAEYAETLVKARAMMEAVGSL